MKKPMRLLCGGLAVAALISCAPPATGPSPSPTPVPAPPAAPLNFGLNGVSAVCVDVRWDDNSNNEDNFIVQRAADALFTLDLAEFSAAANAVRYRDYDGVAPGVTRYYRVLAANAEGRSEATEAAAATPPAEPVTPALSRIADHTVVDRIRQGTVPIAAIQTAKTNLHIAYGHTSHGSQIISGMNGLTAFADAGRCDGTYQYSGTPGLFSWNHDGSGGALHLFEGDEYGSGDLDHDCGYYDATNNWERETRDYLGPVDLNQRGSLHPEINVVIWSWCGQAAGRTEQSMLDTYLTPMNQLEVDYPGIVFVYMTCHLNGGGTEGNLHQRNEQIRAFCRAGNKWLFDFTDIETFDPDGVCYADRHPDDACNYDFGNNGGLDFDPDTGALVGLDRNWALDWQDAHAVNVEWYDCGAAHSQSVIANTKAFAVWWLWCRIAGWDGN